MSTTRPKVSRKLLAAMRSKRSIITPVGTTQHHLAATMQKEVAEQEASLNELIEVLMSGESSVNTILEVRIAAACSILKQISKSPTRTEQLISKVVNYLIESIYYPVCDSDPTYQAFSRHSYAAHFLVRQTYRSEFEKYQSKWSQFETSAHTLGSALSTRTRVIDRAMRLWQQTYKFRILTLWRNVTKRSRKNVGHFRDLFDTKSSRGLLQQALSGWRHVTAKSDVGRAWAQMLENLSQLEQNKAQADHLKNELQDKQADLLSQMVEAREITSSERGLCRGLYQVCIASQHRISCWKDLSKVICSYTSNLRRAAEAVSTDTSLTKSSLPRLCATWHEATIKLLLPWVNSKIQQLIHRNKPNLPTVTNLSADWKSGEVMATLLAALISSEGDECRKKHEFYCNSQPEPVNTRRRKSSAASEYFEGNDLISSNENTEQTDTDSPEIYRKRLPSHLKKSFKGFEPASPELANSSHRLQRFSKFAECDGDASQDDVSLDNYNSLTGETTASLKQSYVNPNDKIDELLEIAGSNSIQPTDRLEIILSELQLLGLDKCVGLGDFAQGNPDAIVSILYSLWYRDFLRNSPRDEDVFPDQFDHNSPKPNSDLFSELMKQNDSFLDQLHMISEYSLHLASCRATGQPVRMFTKQEERDLVKEQQAYLDVRVDQLPELFSSRIAKSPEEQAAREKKNVDELKELLLIISNAFPHVRRAFTYYCGSETKVTGNSISMDFSQFWRFCSECRLVDSFFTKAHAASLFADVNIRNRGVRGDNDLNSFNPDHLLVQCEFVQVILRVSVLKFGSPVIMSRRASGAPIKHSYAVTTLLEQHLVPKAGMTVLSSADFRSQVWSEPVQLVLKKQRPKILKLFKMYAASSSTEYQGNQGTPREYTRARKSSSILDMQSQNSMTLSMSELRKLLQDASLLGKRLSNDDLQDLFVAIQSGGADDDNESLVYSEFEECVACLAAFLNPSPFESLADKVQHLIDFRLSLLTRAKKTEKRR